MHLPRDEGHSALYDNPKLVVVSSTWSMVAVSIAFLGLRGYCRAFRTGQLWWDDYLLALGGVFLIASNCVLTEVMNLGFGEELHPDAHLVLIMFIYDTLHKFALGFAKTSFAVTLLRLVPSHSRQRYVIWFLIVSMDTLLALHSILDWMSLCDSEMYENRLPGKCWDYRGPIKLNIVEGIYSAFSDLCLAFLPWKVIYTLKMKRLEKFGIGFAMSFGVFAALVSLLKGVDAIRKLQANYAPMKDQELKDYYASGSVFWIWAQAEPVFAIIAASIPILRVLFRDLYRSQNNALSPSAAGGYHRSNRQTKFRSHCEGSGQADDSSERNILARDKVIDGGITRTREVTVDFGDVEEYEMMDHGQRQKNDCLSKSSPRRPSA